MSIRLLSATMVAAGLTLGYASMAHAQNAHSEWAVKAAYLYRFTQFVTWPSRSTDPGSIAVLDAPDIAEQLEHILPLHPTKNGPVRVRVIHSSEEIEDASILYIGSKDRRRIESTLNALRGRPILVVTDCREGLSLGAEINFVTIDHRVRFEISTVAAERANLYIGADLLGVASRVTQEAGE